MSKHKHHIIPVYRCKELGIDPDFDENIVEVDRLDHARIHWGYKCDDLEPLFEYITPEQWIIDLIPIGDKRDIWAAQINARGEIDGIDMSGKNSPAYKHGLLVGGGPEARKKYNKINSEKHSLISLKWYRDNMSEELMEKRRIYAREYTKKNKEKVAAKTKEYRNRPENKARKKKQDAERRSARPPEYREKERLLKRAYRAKNMDKIRRKDRERYVRKKAETQGEGI